MGHLQLKASGETPPERVAGWCLWVTVWGPILTIFASFQDDVDYSFFIRYRQFVFPALLVQICLRFAQPAGLKLWKTAVLILLAGLQNPIWMVHFGIAWPWRIINAATVVFSFMAVAEVRDSRVSREAAAGSASNRPKVPNIRAEAIKTTLWGFGWILAAAWLWASAVGNPIHDLRLMLGASTTPGQIIGTWEDVQDGDDGRAHWYHGIAYTFRLPDGREIRAATGSRSGRLSPELVNSKDPIAVEVEYDPRVPSVNRLKGDGSQSLGDWLLRKVVLGGVLLILFMWPGVKLLRDGIAEFRAGQPPGIASVAD
ncbi:MAG TPA: hypothetical protein VJH03_25160 [Blastocatellia bacterium]|nr:hypothetical protein [Blastocatellia bacterium]